MLYSVWKGVTHGYESGIGRSPDRGGSGCRRAQDQKEAVTAALKEYVARREQLGVLKLIGKIEFDPAYCYKDARGDEGPRRYLRLVEGAAVKRRTRTLRP